MGQPELALALGRTGIHGARGLVTLEQMLDIEGKHIPHQGTVIYQKRRALGLPGGSAPASVCHTRLLGEYRAVKGVSPPPEAGAGTEV